jgi:hypothetical protein
MIDSFSFFAGIWAALSIVGIIIYSLIIIDLLKLRNIRRRCESIKH